jgi:MoaA/NifB/PqqE/SkfB family radical SAM enzyme
MKKATMKDIVLAVTYRCNARCRMCGIWQRTDHGGEISPSDLKNLPFELESLNLSGGEPFLRADLPEMVRIAKQRCPKLSITISSNGFATDLVVKRMEEILKIDRHISVAISIDGIGDKHDEIRGIPGGFDRAIQTVRGLKALGVKKLRLAFTAADYNYQELQKVYQLSLELGVEMTLAAVHSSDNYFGKENQINANEQIAAQLDWLIAKELSSWNPKRWLRAYFTHGLQHFVLKGLRILPDYSGELNCFIDPKGDIYPCDVSTIVIGNLKKGFDLTEEKDYVCQHSWMICTARQAIKKHWKEALWWVLKEKMRRFF